MPQLVDFGSFAVTRKGTKNHSCPLLSDPTMRQQLGWGAIRTLETMDMPTEFAYPTTTLHIAYCTTIFT